MNPSFIKPRYDSGGFAGLPAAILSLLGGAQANLPFDGLDTAYDNVILGFVDGFGWRHLERWMTHPALARFASEGRVTRLTSQFPSTTSGHVTCIHTGQNVGQSGVFEWNYYEPQLDAMIVPLLFSFSGTGERDQLRKTGIDAKKLYPSGTIYQELRRMGVTSHIFQHREYTPSTYSDIVFKGARNVRGFKSLAEMLVNLRASLEAAQGKNYFFFYFDKIDSLSHDYGPASPQAQAEIEMFLHALERVFLTGLRKGRTLLLLTADHGQAEVDPQTTIYLNRAFPTIIPTFKTTSTGQPLVPGGSCRDLFLYVKDELLEETHALLARGLEGRADVVPVEALIAAGYFGPQVSPTFRARVGNLVILPYLGESAWWFEKGKFEQKYYGHHGGLTPQEMEIPLLALDLSSR